MLRCSLAPCVCRTKPGCSPPRQRPRQGHAPPADAPVPGGRNGRLRVGVISRDTNRPEDTRPTTAARGIPALIAARDDTRSLYLNQQGSGSCKPSATSRTNKLIEKCDARSHARSPCSVISKFPPRPPSAVCKDVPSIISRWAAGFTVLPRTRIEKHLSCGGTISSARNTLSAWSRPQITCME